MKDEKVLFNKVKNYLSVGAERSRSELERSGSEREWSQSGAGAELERKFSG